jgi:hypothetical protein
MARFCEKYINADYVEIKATPCNNKDCKNYGEYKIIQKENSYIGLVWYKNINFMTCMICEHFIKKDCYIK